MVDCDSGNGYDGRIGLRVSSIFVIGFGSMLGTIPARCQFKLDFISNFHE
jgi:hypothetical protein